MKIQKPIAVISMVRNDSFFTEKWISYYGKHLGFEHLYLFLDGMDQKVPRTLHRIKEFKKGEFSQVNVMVALVSGRF